MLLAACCAGLLAACGSEPTESWTFRSPDREAWRVSEHPLGRGTFQPANVRFGSNAHLMKIIDKIVSGVGRRIDESTPMVDARLPDGSRVNAIIPPLALDGPLLATNLAAIYAQIGRRDKALAILEGLVSHIGGPTPGTLRIEPQWDPLRSDPRFQRLLG